MNSISDLPAEEFETRLTGLTVKIQQVLVLGLMAVTLSMAAVLVWLGLSGWGPAVAPEGGVALAHFVSAAHVAVLLVAVPLVWASLSMRFRVSSLERYARDGLHDGENSLLKDPADIAMHLVRLENILPMAALDGAAMVGMVATFLAINEGSIHQSSFYWLNLSSVALVLLRGLLAFPTAERMRRVFLTRIKKQAY